VPEIGLAEAIKQIRDELGEAQDAGSGQQLQFEVLEVAVEFLVEIRKEVGSGAKVQIGVLAAGADGRIDHGAAHRLTFKLRVKDNATGGQSVNLGRHDERSWTN
jgi:Trypsin-co-occurring domain 2